MSVPNSSDTSKTPVWAWCMVASLGVLAAGFLVGTLLKEAGYDERPWWHDALVWWLGIVLLIAVPGGAGQAKQRFDSGWHGRLITLLAVVAGAFIIAACWLFTS